MTKYNKEEKPTFSIICATYNCKDTLPNLLESVKAQIIDDYELIVVDGGSIDGTIDVLKRYEDVIDNSIIEKDKGIYDAWNKGIQLVRGKWVCFIGSDDTLSNDFLATYKEKIDSLDHEVDYISAKANYVNSNGDIIAEIGKAWKWHKFRISMSTAHVGSMHSINLFNELGLFNISFHITGDYEFLLRKRSKLKTEFIEKTIVNMQSDGRSLSLKALKERYKAQVNTGGLPKIVAMAIYLAGIFFLIDMKRKVS